MADTKTQDPKSSVAMCGETYTIVMIPNTVKTDSGCCRASPMLIVCQAAMFASRDKFRGFRIEDLVLNSGFGL